MALPTKQDILTLDYPSRGLPLVSSPAQTSIDTQTMDYPSRGLPFITNPDTSVTTNSKDNSVKANILVSNNTQSNSVKSNILVVTSQSNSVKANIKSTTSQDNSAKADILVINNTQAVSVKANVLVTTSQSSSVKANIKATTPQNNVTKANILVVNNTQSNSVKSNIPSIKSNYVKAAIRRKMEELEDDWEFAYVDSGKWDNWGGARVTVVNRQLELSSTTGAGYYGITSDILHDFTGSYAFTQLVDAGNQSITSWEVYPIHLSRGTNAISIMVAGNIIYARKKISGTTTTVGSTIPYDSAIHKWFRIRESGGTTYWEYATDPTGLWVEIASASNPITVTGLNGEVLVGTWQFEALTTRAYVDNFNVLPGELQFNWKGYQWNKRIYVGDDAYNSVFNKANVVEPDGNDYITLKLTNPSLNYPVGSEIFSTQRGWGYGTYTVVVGTQLDTMHHAVVAGGLFLFDFTDPPAYREIDVNEVRDYASNPNIRILKSHVWNNGGVREFITDDMDVPSDVVQTHRLIWAADKLTFDSYLGTGTAGTNYFHAEHTTHLPTPGIERPHFQVWVLNVPGKDASTPLDLVFRDFSFVSTNTQNNSVKANIVVANNTKDNVAKANIEPKITNHVKACIVNVVTQSSSIKANIYQFIVYSQDNTVVGNIRKGIIVYKMGNLPYRKHRPIYVDFL